MTAPNPIPKEGDAVWYEPRPGYRFAAVVDSEPWCLGEHTVVVRLRELGDDYRLHTGRNRSTVSAAAVRCLTPRIPAVVPTEISALDLESFEVEPIQPDPCEVCCELEEQDATQVVTITWVVIGTLISAQVRCCDEHAKELRGALTAAMRDADAEVPS